MYAMKSYFKVCHYSTILEVQKMTRKMASNLSDMLAVPFQQYLGQRELMSIINNQNFYYIREK